MINADFLFGRSFVLVDGIGQSFQHTKLKACVEAGNAHNVRLISRGLIHLEVALITRQLQFSNLFSRFPSRGFLSLFLVAAVSYRPPGCRVRVYHWVDTEIY